MDEFSILTNKKRAVIALIHSVVFLLIATWQMLSGVPAAGLWALSRASTGTWILCGVFLVVSSILLWLFVVSRHWSERFYFALCTVSASSGLIRTICGDHLFHAGLYIRVVILASAVIVGIAITRMHATGPLPAGNVHAEEA